MLRLWLEFDPTRVLPPGLAYGCGVTGYNYEDAIKLVQTQVFTDGPMPDPVRLVENVDVSQLNTNHVLPNMGNPLARGIWFPLGYG